MQSVEKNGAGGEPIILLSRGLDTGQEVIHIKHHSRLKKIHRQESTKCLDELVAKIQKR